MKTKNKLLFIIKDIARCVYIGLLIAGGSALLMLLLGLIFRQNILMLIYVTCFSIGSMALSVAGISFLKPSTLRPLDHKEEWENYFKILNIGLVLFFIGITLFLVGITVYDINFSLTNGVY